MRRQLKQAACILWEGRWPSVHSQFLSKGERYLRRYAPRSHEVRAADSEEEVIERVFVGYVDRSHARFPLVPVRLQRSNE